MANEDNKNVGTLDGVDNEDLVIHLKKPVTFEGEKYGTIDLNKLHDIKTSDMVAINRRMSRNGSDYLTPEVTLEYALNMANIATGLPLEFFDGLPPYVGLTIKNRVTVFLFRQE